MSEEALKRRLAREREARKQAELTAEEKTRALYMANEELRNLSENLEQLVEDRTVELAKARDEALAASRAKSEFLANMSHEIRTPLNAVIGLTEMLLETQLNSEQHDFVATINNSGEALLSIINDILDFSKIESGHLELESRPFDLRNCIEEALDLLAGKATEKGLELAYIFDGQTPAQIVGDEVRLRQVLLNLINNAVKFTTEGEVVVEVACKSLNIEDGKAQSYEIQVSVRDTGIGIPKDKMDRLFKSFSQVDASTTRKFGGTGLGLVISRRLSEMMGGTMWVESEGVPGRGSVFHFTLTTQAAPSQRRVYLQSKQPALNGKRVLVVDDNETNRRILHRQFEGWGMIVQLAESGEEALHYIRAGEALDLAILDMQMPEMDGVTLAKDFGSPSAVSSIVVVARSRN